MFGGVPRAIIDQQPPLEINNPSFASLSSNTMLNDKNFPSNNILLNRIRERHNATTYQPMEINARNFYSHLNFMTIKWAQSLSQRMLKYHFFLSHPQIFFFQKINASLFSFFFRQQFLF